jgi:outer membrane lipoprotein-sorting protein
MRAVLIVWCVLGALLASPARGGVLLQPSRNDGRPHGDQPTRTQDARLEEIDKRIGAITDLRAQFEQRRHTPLLKAPMVSSGRVVLKSERVRWDTMRPRPSVMTIDRREVRIHDPEARVLEVYEVSGSLAEFSGSPLPRLETLRRNFSFAPMAPGDMGAPAGDDRYVGIELTPVTEDLRDHVSRVRVVLDSSVPCVSVIEILDADGERTEIRFTEVRTNAGVKESELALEVPAGTRVSRPMGGAGPSRSTPENPRGAGDK